MVRDDGFEVVEEGFRCPYCGASVGEGASKCPNCDELLPSEVGLDGSPRDEEWDEYCPAPVETDATGEPPGVLLSAGGEVLTVLHDIRRVSTCVVGGRPVRMPYADSE